MLNTYATALAPGTYANREKQARCYLTFAVLYNVPYLTPSPVHICMFAQYLANKFGSVASVKNYMSGAHTWVLEHGGDTLYFSCYQQSTMVKAITKASKHVVSRAFPLTADHIRRIVSYLDKARNAPACIKPCILIGFSCYLRSSNLVSPTSTAWGGTHTLLARNVIDCGSSLKVVINSTKSRSVPFSLILPQINDLQMCPVKAWRDYRMSARLTPNGPAFVLNSVTPLCAPLVVKIMKDALCGDPEIDVQQISMHSIRRGAAQQAERIGCPLSDIVARGAWASPSSVTPYLTK